MTLAPRLRAMLLAAGLGLTVAAIGWVESRDDPAGETRAAAGPAAATRSAGGAENMKVPDAARRPQAASAPATPEAQVPAGPAPAVDLTRARRTLQPLAVDAFAPRSWAPPPRKLTVAEQAAAAPPPPPPPQAPPLPYRYVGMMGDDGRTTLFLANGDRDVMARPGDVLDGVWRLELVNEQRALFVYVPLQQSRTLTLGAR
jgi:hypothetical protein